MSPYTNPQSRLPASAHAKRAMTTTADKSSPQSTKRRKGAVGAGDRAPQEQAKPPRAKGIQRELDDLLETQSKRNEAEGRYRRLQADRKANPWAYVAVTTTPEVEPVAKGPGNLAVAQPNCARAPQFQQHPADRKTERSTRVAVPEHHQHASVAQRGLTAVAAWKDFCEKTSDERWISAHAALYEYRELHMKMLAELTLVAASQDHYQAELKDLCATLPALAAQGPDVPKESVESSAWLEPWNQFVRRNVPDAWAAGLRAFNILSRDIRGKYAMFLAAVDGLANDPLGQQLLRRAAVTALQD